MRNRGCLDRTTQSEWPRHGRMAFHVLASRSFLTPDPGRVPVAHAAAVDVQGEFSRVPGSQAAASVQPVAELARVLRRNLDACLRLPRFSSE